VKRVFLLFAAACLLCGSVIGYGADVFQGRVLTNTSDHELATLLNLNGRSVDSNGNGIIDAADNCGSCSSGGGAPQTMLVYGRLNSGGWIDATQNGALGPTKLPLQLSPSARLTHIRVRRLCGTLGSYQCGLYISTAAIEIVRVTIDWVGRTITGYAVAPSATPIGWNVANAQSDTVYIGVPVTGAPPATCGQSEQCSAIEIDVDARVIKKLPLGIGPASGCGFSAVVSTYG